MSDEIGRITPRKIPASQAIPGNAEHAKLIKQHKKNLPSSAHWSSKVRTGLAGPVLFGLLIIALFLAAFGFWAARAPIAGAAVAPGLVTASGQNFTVQHFEGGIIKDILVREGARVAKGQPLLELDPTRALSERDRLSKGLISMRARARRLIAERDGTDIDFPSDLVADAEANGLQGDLLEQRREFQKRQDRLAAEAKIIDQQVQALQQQIGGIEVQIKSTKDQVAVLNDEITVKEELVKRQLTPKSDFLRLQRSRSELEGRLGELVAGIGEARASILQAQEKKSQLFAGAEETAVTAFNDLRQQMTDFQERILNAENILQRVIVRSPADGTVVKINKNTPGSVVRQGEDLFVILPGGGELIVEAKINPLDVDSVSVGQSANLRFSSLNARITPEVPGEVTYVSADRLVDPATNESYYSARLKISQFLPDSIEPSQIFPGMPVETYIQTGDRTFFEYLVKPLTDSFSRAFREN